MASQIIAAELLNTQGALQLMADLKNARNDDVEVDVSAVRHLGAQALQILMSAQKTWGTEKKNFVLASPSPDFVLGLKALGGEAMLHEDSIV